MPFDLPAGPADVSLNLFAKQSGVDVAYATRITLEVKTNAVKGLYTPTEAITRLLAKSGLVPVFDANSRTFTVKSDSPKTMATHRVNLVTLLRRALFSALFAITWNLQAQSQSENDTAAPSKKADKTDEVVKLSPFEVLGDQNQGYVASETMSGSRVVTKIFDVPASVTVVTRDLIDDLGAVDPWQAMSKSVSGVTTFAAPGIFSGVLIRGFRAQFWAEDGATIASIGPSNNFNYDGMEVIKGPSALLYGPFGAYGGYVNLIPKWAHSNPVNKLELSVGTDSFTSGMLDVGQALTKSGDLQGRLVLGDLHYNRPGWPGDYTHTFTFAPSFSYDISDKVKVKTRLEWNDRKWRFSVAPLNPVSGKPMVGFSPNNFFPDTGNIDRDLITQTELTGKLSDEWSFRMQFQTESDHTIQVSAGFASPTPKVPINSPLTLYKSKADYYYKQFTIDMTTSWDTQEFAPHTKNHLVTGVTMNNWNDNYRFNASSNNTLLYPQYNQAPWTTFSLSNPLPASAYDSIILSNNALYQPYNSQWLGGVMGTDTLDLLDGKVKLIAGTRYNFDERYYLSETPTSSTSPLTGTPSVDSKSTIFLKRYGAIFQPAKYFDVYYGHDEGYLNVPALTHFDGSPVLPETGKNDEVGIKSDDLRALGGSFYGSIAYFKLQVSNKWRGDPDHPGFYVSDGFQKNNGWDAQIDYTSNGNRFTAILGFYSADGPTAITGLRAVYAPKVTSNFWIRYNISNAIAVGGGMTHQGDTLDAYNVEASKPFTSYDLFCEYKQKLSASSMVIYRLGMTNVGNTVNNYLLVNSVNAYTLDQRQTKLTVTYVW